MSRLRVFLAALLAVLVVAGCTASAPREVSPSAEEVPPAEVQVEEAGEELPPVIEQMPEPKEASPEPVMAELPDDPLSELTSTAGKFVVWLGADATLDVPLKTMPVQDGVVDPPTYEDACLVEGYGTPNGGGTTYVAMHSGRGIPEAAGSALIDTKTGKSTLHGGELVFVDGVTYEVTEVRVLRKGSVATEIDTWEQVNGRLVVFTCIPLDSGPGVNHVVLLIAEKLDLYS